MIKDTVPQDENSSDLSPDDRSLRPISGKQPLSYEALRDIIDLTLWTGQMLLQFLPNSERVESAVHHIGTGLGCDWIDVDVSLDALTTTTNSGQDFRTKTRRIIRRGVNYQIVAALNDLGVMLPNETATASRRELNWSRSPLNRPVILSGSRCLLPLSPAPLLTSYLLGIG